MMSCSRASASSASSSTAPAAPLLRYVSGMNQLTARRVYEHRQQHGPFTSRQQLLEVNGFGEATFVQAAGFLKIERGDNPLDATWIHPENYAAAERLLAKLGDRADGLDRRRHRRTHQPTRRATRSPAIGRRARHRPTHDRRHDRSSLQAGPRPAQRFAAADLPQGRRQVRRPRRRHGAARHRAQRRRLRRVRRRRPFR